MSTQIKMDVLRFEKSGTLAHLRSGFKIPDPVQENTRKTSGRSAAALQRLGLWRDKSGRSLFSAYTGVCEHLPEACDALSCKKIDANPAQRGNAAIGAF